MLPFISCMTFRPPWDDYEECLKRKRIVLIENDAVTRWQLTKALRRAGVDIVATADSGLQGIEQVLEYRPDLVILEIGPPLPNGLEVARRILERRQVCILLLSDRDNEAVREQARQLGVSGYLVKPLTSRDLVSTLEQAYIAFQHANP